MASLETKNGTMTPQGAARLAHILKVIKEGNDSLTTQFNFKTAEISCSISAQMAEIKNSISVSVDCRRPAQDMVDWLADRVNVTASWAMSH